ncbi:MAG: hypothetical protein WDO56_04010 [Gammaproteobacteria bacterium]
MADTTELSARIETIERGYEYLLAYAAQGRQNEQGSEARQRLTEMFDALDGLAELVTGTVNGGAGGPVAQAAPFVEAMKQDAWKARGAIGLVLSRPAISSLLVDNLNASIHLRALLTDCFLVEQAYR